MFRSVFQPYGLVWTIFDHITDVLVLSLCWCICSLPIFTIGAASTALYDAVAHGVRNREGGTYRRFFRTFRAELKTGLGITILWGCVLIFGAWALAMLEEIGASDSRFAVLAGAYRVVMLLPLAAACWSPIILSRFTYSFLELVVIAVRYIFAHPLASAALAILTWIIYHYTVQYALGLSFSPALCALGWTYLAEPVFQKYGAGLVSVQEEVNEG